LLAKATIALDQQDWATAEKHLRELNRRFADLLEPYLVLSDTLTIQGKHQEASEILRRARQIDADALPLLKRLGLNSLQRGDLSSALAAFTRAWNQTPQDHEILGSLSTTCLDLGLHEEAKQYYRQALKDNPKNIELWLGLAGVARRLEDRETLEEATEQAAALNPAHPRLLELSQSRIPAGDASSPVPIGDRRVRSSGSEQVPASIIIPVFNNLELTQNCLESIWEHTPPELFEIIVVDNGSSDGTPAFLKQLATEGKIRLIANDTNLGYAKACNQGARAARGGYLIMLNNDTLVTDGWLNALIEAVAKDDNLAVVGAKLLYPNDSGQHAAWSSTKRARSTTSTGTFTRTIPRSTRPGNSRWLPVPACLSAPRFSSRRDSMMRASLTASKMWTCACGWGSWATASSISRTVSCTIWKA
jgi:tetratricopeptide (TPR) repeat protein